ncbi:MAG: ribonuclease H [Actinomycetaceae bacterium]|nr:ribonuclease H [Actinomycetaceae bacterium]
MTIVAAADGSALDNPGPMGWAWYVDDDTWQAGGAPSGTNNIGELSAVLALLRATAHTGEDLLIYCDSQYVINSMTKWIHGWKRNGWRTASKKPVANADLIRAIDAELRGRVVRFEWVRGHAGHDLNEAADSRARACATAYRDGSEVPGGPGFGGVLANVDPASPVGAASSLGSPGKPNPVGGSNLAGAAGSVGGSNLAGAAGSARSETTATERRKDGGAGNAGPQPAIPDDVQDTLF